MISLGSSDRMDKATTTLEKLFQIPSADIASLDLLCERFLPARAFSHCYELLKDRAYRSEPRG